MDQAFFPSTSNTPAFRSWLLRRSFCVIGLLAALAATSCSDNEGDPNPVVTADSGVDSGDAAVSDSADSSVTADASDGGSEASVVNSVSGNLVDLIAKKTFAATITIENGKIAKIVPNENKYDNYILPGFIDAHVHIESSMLVPSEFAKQAVRHGTVATVSDPHEIANVLGIAGVDYMINNGKTVPFKFFFGASPCVPATTFETAGATLGVTEVGELISRPEIKYMSEMMNYPGVLFADKDVLAKIQLAKDAKKPIDGHAPGLTGDDLKKYVAAGMSTDHETLTLDEAKAKIGLGMKILIREGSAAKEFDAFYTLIADYPGMTMLASDDKHPDDLVKSHINDLVKRAVAKGVDPMKVLEAASVTPVKHYGLDVGLLQDGDSADFIVVKDMTSFEVQETYVKGQLVAKAGKSLIVTTEKAATPNKFEAVAKTTEDFKLVPQSGETKIKVIKALDGQLFTQKVTANIKVDSGNVVSDPDQDVLKIAVANRYKDAKPSIGFIQGFGLKGCGIATSIAHDSHNVLVIGTTDQLMRDAANLVIASKGGLAVVSAAGKSATLALPVAGLMSNLDGETVASDYAKIDQFVKTECSTPLSAPYMTLSFMALLVIPELKLSDLGLFDGKAFKMVSVFGEN